MMKIILFESLLVAIDTIIKKTLTFIETIYASIDPTDCIEQ